MADIPKKFPAFQLYVKDWLSSERITLMPPECEGCLIRLLCMQWDGGTLPADPALIKALLPIKYHDGTFERCWKVLVGHFEDAGAGRIAHPKLARQLLAWQKFIRGKQAAGIASGNVRAKQALRRLTDDEQVLNNRSTGAERNMNLPLPLPLPLTLDSAVDSRSSKAEKVKSSEALSVKPPEPPDTGPEEAKAADRKRKQDALNFAARVVFSYWRAQMGRNGNTYFDDKRRTRLVSRLRENGGNVAELLHCVDGALRDDWIMGRDKDSKRKYDDVDQVFRDRAQVERLAALANPVSMDTHPFLERDS